jgi:hypothetical protein
MRKGKKILKMPFFATNHVGTAALELSGGASFRKFLPNCVELRPAGQPRAAVCPHVVRGLERVTEVLDAWASLSNLSP